MSVIPRLEPPELSLSLIRDFELRCDGEPVPLALSSQRLVAFLALQSTPLRRTYVSGTLWFGSDERHAAASLRSALWRLPPVNLVRVSATHLWLNPEIQVDVHRVIADAKAVLRCPPTDDDLLILTHELTDIGDDLLLGWYDDWLIVEREHCRRIRLQALDCLGERLLENGSLNEAFQVGLAATRTDPLRESAHRLLVAVDLRNGNVAEAIRRYHLYAKLLRTELGGQPSPALHDLVSPYLLPTAADDGVAEPASEREADRAALPQSAPSHPL